MENTPPVVPASTEAVTTPKKKAPFPKIKVSNRTLILGFVAIVILGSAYAYRSFFVAATIDGKPVSRLAVLRQLEDEGGERALDAIITERIIASEAAKAGIDITSEETDQELEIIKTQVSAQGMNLEDALTQQGMTLDDLKKQIVTRKQLEKLLGDKLTVTDGDIDAYLTEAKLTPPEGTSEADFRVQVKEELSGQKFGAEAEKWVTEAREKADIKYLIDYGAPGSPEEGPVQ